MADRILELSGLPLDPYFSAGKLAWLLEHDEAVARAREAGTLRMGTVDSFLCDRLGAGFAPIPRRPRGRSSGRRSGTPSCSRSSACRGRCCRRSPTPRATWARLRHPSWPAELPLRARCPDQQAALAGAGCVEPGRTKATYGTGVFVLANVGTERPAGYGRAAADGRLAGRRARSSGRSTAACSRPARCSNGSPATSGSRPTRAALRASPRRWRMPAACACCRRSPGSEPPGGGPARGLSSPG